MLAVCIIFLSSFLSVFVATFIFRRAHIGQMPTFYTIITFIVFEGHSLLPFSRGERSLEVDLDHGYCSWGGSSLPPVYKQFRCFPLYFLK